MSSANKAIAAIAALSLVVVGMLIVVQQTGSGDAGAQESVTPADRNYAVEIQRARSSGAGGASSTDLRDMLPNVVYEYEGQELSLSHDLILGECTAIRPGRAYRADDQDDTQVTDWDSESAQWRSVFVTLTPEDGTPPLELEFTLRGDDDLERFGAGMRALGRVAVLTGKRPDREDELDPEVKGVAAVATIADDGGLDLPFVEDRVQARSMLDGLNTVEALQEAAAEPTRTIKQSEWEAGF